MEKINEYDLGVSTKRESHEESTPKMELGSASDQINKMPFFFSIHKNLTISSKKCTIGWLYRENKL